MQNVSRKVKITGRLIKSVFVALLAASLLLSGCGDSSEPLDRAEASQPSTEQSANANNTSGKSLFSDALYCHVTEKSISDPTKGFVDDPENRTKYPPLVDSFADTKMNLSLTDSFSAAGTLYLLYNITYTMEENKEYIEIPGTYYFLYTLEAPYEQWYCYPFSSDCWATVNPDSSITIPNIKSIAGVCKNGVYFQLLSGDIGYYSQFGDSRLMEEFKTDSESPATFTLYHTDETLYAVSSDLFSNGSFTSYDEQLKPVLTQNLENQLCGGFSSGSEFLWYGFDEQQNLAVWDKPNGTQLFSLGNIVNSYSDFLLTKSAAGEFILADISGIWAGNGTASMQKILSFAERGYALQELLALNVNEDGSLSLITQFEDSLCLLILEGSDEPDRQEVTVVSTDTASLSDVVASFNRRNDKYRVTLVNPFDSNDFYAYCQQIQMEISAGRGPDLVQAGLIDLEGCIDNGYVESLEDVIENPSDYWPGCLECGRRNGVLYSIPYYVVVSCLTASESLTGGLNAWTLEQMIEAVRRSPAEALEINLDSLNIVLQYGLGIRDNTQFIDYDAGVSHLTEQPFIDFLEFAKKYGDNLHYTADSDHSEAAEYYHDGRLAFYTLTMYDPGNLLFTSILFQEQDALIGMPSTQGRGVYMDCNALVLNSNSQSKDCAKEFLRYLMSTEGQIEFSRNTLTFSCRRDVSDMILEDYQIQSAESESSYGHFGLISKSTPLSDEQIEQLFTLFEDARPKWELPSEIYNIACEELEPYFAGDCSAEDAAWKLNNRVQLYLDERK